MSEAPYGDGLAGRCPRCGQASMFDGFLKLQETCPSCELDYGFADAGDGPVAFIVLIVGAIVVGGSFVTWAAFDWPAWLQALVWLPVTVILTLSLMRPAKGLLIALQYHHKAEEGRLAD